MNLADYSDSDTENDKNEAAPVQSKANLVKGPNASQTQTRKTTDTKEDEILQKKVKLDNGSIVKPVRNIAHVEGNFSSVVYVKVSISEELYLFYQNLKLFFLNKSTEEAPLVMLDADSLHISLSKTIFLNFHQIESILAKMQKSLASFESFNCTLDFGSLKIFANENKNRWFTSLLVKGGKLHYHNLISNINKVLESFKAEKFFEDPQPHLSVGWSLKSIDDELIQKFYSEYPETKEQSELLQVTELVFQIGKRQNIIRLKKAQ